VFFPEGLDLMGPFEGGATDDIEESKCAVCVPGPAEMGRVPLMNRLVSLSWSWSRISLEFCLSRLWPTQPAPEPE